MATRPLLLDLFCGEGGCSAGYVAAGFDVVGVDLHPKPRYPYEFVQGDALTYLADPVFMARFDAVHASPPCKSENPLRHLHDVQHPDLLTPTLAALRAQSLPWVVENVEATDKLPGALLLCGASFGLSTTCKDGVQRALKRHRLFESSVFLMRSGCACGSSAHRAGQYNPQRIIGVYGNGGGGQMTRGYKGNLAESRAVMGMPWASREGVSQAIPPAYTRFIGEQLIEAMA